MKKKNIRKNAWIVIGAAFMISAGSNLFKSNIELAMMDCLIGLLMLNNAKKISKEMKNEY